MPPHSSSAVYGPVQGNNIVVSCCIKEKFLVRATFINHLPSYLSSFSDIFATGGGERKAKTKKKAERKVAGKASKSQVNDNEKAPDIFDDPLNVLGGD